MKSLVPLCFLSLAIVQCHPGQGPSASSNARGANRTADAAADASEREPICSSEKDCPAYQDIEDEDAVAVQPTSVAGAFLACMKAADPAFIACQVQTEKAAIRVPASARLDWSIVTATDNVPTTARVHDGLAAGTFFFVSRPIGPIASIQLNVIEGEAFDALSFASNRLPSEESGIQLMAMPTEVIPPSSIESTASFDLDETLGNGVLSDENDACLGQVDGSAANRTLSKDINYADDAGKVSLYADRICGLQNSKVYMTLTPEPPAQKVQVRFVPNARRLLLFKEFNLVPGPMSFTFGYLNNDSQDDVKLGSFTFVR